uniref:Uncharacterized protein n=1 Tax=Siphoviridae sp. ct6bU4 TaxID=2825344 RepID=A0A8S5VAB7_9CAUD|nr:MAG TPA: hypothetical protein [Siphoviridae sp. ct6bU4]
MHIYIRTGSDENNGIEFIDGTKWEEMGSRTGFNYYPGDGTGEPTRYTPKTSNSLNTVPFGDRGLAALLLAEHKLGDLDPRAEVQSLTWIRSNSPLIHDLKQLFTLQGNNPVRLLSEIQETISKYLRINGPGYQTEIAITAEDLARVELDSGERMNKVVLDGDKPQGFTVTGEDGSTVTRFTIPGFLRTLVYRLPDEQRHLAILYLASEKLRNLPSDTPIHRVTFQSEGLGYASFYKSNDVIPDLKTNPVKAWELRGHLLNIIAAYTE